MLTYDIKEEKYFDEKKTKIKQINKDNQEK